MSSKGNETTKAGKKMLDGLKEAVEVAKCIHDLVPQPTARASSLRKFYCTKCGATIWQQKIGRL